MRNMRRYLIIAIIVLFVVGWLATGSLSALFATTMGYVLNYGSKAICIALPVIAIVWLLYKIIKP